MKKTLFKRVSCLCLALMLGCIFTGSSFANQNAEKTEEKKSVSKKVAEKVSEAPEKAGNFFLSGFNKIGSWLSRKSGNRFETKWKSEAEDKKEESIIGSKDDPASGT